jgi:UDP-N-acetylglucosamine:LPS N-acetylglucosamine transferase
MYSRVGGGHLSAARALVTELEATGRCSAQAVDVYVDCGRFPVTRFPQIYAWLARSRPRLWSLVYHGSSASRLLKLEPSFVVGPFLRGGVRLRLKQERPDVVIGVLPAVNEVLSEVCAQAGARLEVVLTDWHSVHPFWVAPGVSHYTAPTESARADCIRYGAPASCVDVVGIPVRREFASFGEPDRSRRLASVGLDPDRFTILAMVGAEGSPDALRNLAALARSDLDAQLVVVCGRSRKLRARIEALPARMPLRALGFVDGISALMRASDVLVTKAGGLTLAEAFCCGIPVVIQDVLPGQEAGNLKYVLQHGAAAYAPTPVALVETVAGLAAHPERRQQLAECGSRLARPQAARDIAASILGRLGSKA